MLTSEHREFLGVLDKVPGGTLVVQLVQRFALNGSGFIGPYEDPPWRQAIAFTALLEPPLSFVAHRIVAFPRSDAVAALSVHQGGTARLWFYEELRRTSYNAGLAWIMAGTTEARAALDPLGLRTPLPGFEFDIRLRFQSNEVTGPAVTWVLDRFVRAALDEGLELQKVLRLRERLG